MALVPVRSIPIHQLKPGFMVRQQLTGTIVKLDTADITPITDPIWAQMCGQRFEIYLAGNDHVLGGRVYINPERDAAGNVVIYDTIEELERSPFWRWLKELFRVDWFSEMAKAHGVDCPFCLDFGKMDDGETCSCPKGRFRVWVEGLTPEEQPAIKRVALKFALANPRLRKG